MSGEQPEDDAGFAFELRSFGRRHGRKLSPRQQRLLDAALPPLLVDLSRPLPTELSSLFAVPVREAWLEIGFGGGEHLVWQAERDPGVGLIGCEPFEEGVVKVLTAVEERRLANIRLHPDDARDLLRALPEASLGRAFVLFPDPWPKKRHVKRRLVNPATLALLARALKPGGELRIGTDIGDYARTMMEAFAGEPRLAWTARSAADWRRRPDDWPETRYEQKAKAAGRACYYFRFERVRSPA